MTQHQFIPTTLEANAFNCSHCRVYARQHWFFLKSSELATGYGANRFDKRFRVSYCESCGHPTIWLGEVMIYPNSLTAEPPNSDLPSDIAADYDEAREIANKSPRGAAALLRLAIQKLCIHLGRPGKNINDDIKALVAAGLPPKVQEALDIVRVIGNDSVHPGTFDLRDDRATALQLFRLVNFIAQKMIAEPREIAEHYGNLPADKLAAIQKRDSGGP
jgi:hypothetical protein